MKKAFQKSARTGMIAVMETLHIGKDDPVAEAAIESIYSIALRQCMEPQLSNDEVNDTAQAICQATLQNKYDILQEYEEDFFEDCDVAIDHKAMKVAILCGDFLTTLGSARSDYKSIANLGGNMLERATHIWQTSEQYLEKCAYPTETPSLEAIFCATVTVLERIRDLDKDLQFADIHEALERFGDEIMKQAEFVTDPQTEIGKQTDRELRILRSKMLRTFNIPVQEYSDQGPAPTLS